MTPRHKRSRCWRPRRRLAEAVLLLAALAAAAACGDDGETGTTGASDASSPLATAATQPVIDPGDGGDYNVAIDPARFSSVVDNHWFPLLPGSRWEYLASGADGDSERIVVEVLDRYRTVMGVNTVVVHDVVTDAEGAIIEDTYDWFAQDVDGNVWYFGEDTTSYDDGVASKHGSWEAGVDGALPGIVMMADTVSGETGYRQEFLAGEAEDMGQVIAVGRSVTIAVGSYTDTVTTRDWTPLEPDVIEEKTYAAGVGLILEVKTSGDGTGEQTELTAFVAGSPSAGA